MKIKTVKMYKTEDAVTDSGYVDCRIVKQTTKFVYVTVDNNWINPYKLVWVIRKDGNNEWNGWGHYDYYCNTTGWLQRNAVPTGKTLGPKKFHEELFILDVV
jgi:hypothetical protein